MEFKVRWPLEQDEDEWPPYPVESIWCAQVEGNHFRLINVPYFAKDVAWGDVVSAKGDDELWWFERVVQRSGYATVHISSFDAEKTQRLLDWCKANAGILETAFNGKYFALGIPPAVAQADWMAFLQGLESSGENAFEFEVACHG
jgi:Domain of unknown function (DUF4265)